MTCASPDSDPPRAPEDTPAPQASTAPDAELARLAAREIAGDYQTPTGRGSFHVEVRGLDIHIFTGWRMRKRVYNEDGNIIFFNKEELIREAIAFVRAAAPEGVRLGSARENTFPDPDTFEAWLRHKSFALSGSLASYFPAILHRLGAIRFERRKRALWAVPVMDDDAAPATPPGADA